MWQTRKDVLPCLYFHLTLITNQSSHAVSL
ncbi:hypothetical protein E2C01_074495 [Portunus trituberculatus]|uniref:Uncharacterized protein n=1 Tax=Portunus trituberculatus TaxID=210409 RepID=A0A5B7IEG0_PORTR|nr:hypothetical protein [Portunus trituberculatus]